VESWYRDLLLGFRALRRTPVFCLTAILTIALGIGANTAVFSLLYGLLLRSLPVANPQQLARVGLVSTALHSEDQASFLTYRMLQQYSREQQSFTGISAWDHDMVTMKDSQGTLRLYDAGMVSGNTFPVLGMKPYAGRLIAPSDDVRGGPPSGWPAVLSYGFWNTRFDADPSVIGKQMEVQGTPVTVIGIAPPDFHGVWPGFDLRLYLPFQFLNVIIGRDAINTPNSFFECDTIGRLAPGVSIRPANAELALYQKQLLKLIPSQYQKLPIFQHSSFKVESARTGLPTTFGHSYSEPLFLLQGLVALVLLLCCINVGGLMMSKVYARQHEFAIRTAIGAARWRLMRQYLTESAVIAFGGAALGAVWAWYGSGLLLQQNFFRSPLGFEGMSIRPDRTVFWATGILAVLATLLFGALPAWRAGRSDPGMLLKSRTTTASRKQIAGRAFVPVQVALSVVLVALATLLSQSLVRLRTEHLGFDANHVTIQTAPFNMLPQKGDARLDVYQRMVDRIDEMPGIQSAAVTWNTPVTGYQPMARFQAISGSGADVREDSRMAYNGVGPGYFRTMKTALLSGREFQKNERLPNVCILNEAAANFLFPHQQALGQYVRSIDAKQLPQPNSCRVIGIAEDARFATLREAPPPTIYFPVTKEILSDAYNLVFLINSGTKAEAIAGYRKALKEIAPSIPLVIFVTLNEQIDAALGSQRLITAMSNIFAVLALFLSALGLYGLLSSSVSQRTAEIGVRIALGAERGTVLRMILSEALRLLGAGVLLGAVVLFFAVRFIKGMLYGVSAFDPVTLVATLVLLTIVTLFAAMLPALRAASVDPIEALRAE
jgi:predicted permease